MSIGNSNKSLRKAIGSIKDTTTIGLAKVKSGYKELDVAIVKATNHVERPTNEKHLQSIFAAVSAGQPRADVAYCIHALTRRLTRTRNWAVALKTLMVIHRAIREVDSTFHEELINYGRNQTHILNMAHFKDDSSPNAWNYSAWVRSYASFLEERLECYRILKYDIDAERPRARDLDVTELLDLLPTLQQLIYRVIACEPIGATSQNYMIHFAVAQIALDSMKIYNAISEGTINLIDKFFEMKRNDAIKALDIYRRTGQQADRLAEFYDTCSHLDGCRGKRFIKIEQRPASFLLAMEEYVRGINRGLSFPKEQVKQMIDERKDARKVVLTIEERNVEEEDEEDEEEEEEEEDRPPSPPSTQRVKDEKAIIHTFNLLDLDDPPQVEKKPLALSILPFADQHSILTTPPKQEDRVAGWEVALVTTAPNSNAPTSIPKNMSGGLNKLMMDYLYDDSIRRSNQAASYNSWDVTTMGNPMMQHQQGHDQSFFVYNNSMAPTPQSMQMTAMNQQQAFMLQQQQKAQMMMMMPQTQMMMMPMQKQPQLMMSLQQPPQAMSQIGNSYGPNVYSSGMNTQTYNPYSGLL